MAILQGQTFKPVNGTIQPLSLFGTPPFSSDLPPFDPFGPGATVTPVASGTKTTSVNNGNEDITNVNNWKSYLPFQINADPPSQMPNNPSTLEQLQVLAGGILNGTGSAVNKILPNINPVSTVQNSITDTTGKVIRTVFIMILVGVGLYAVVGGNNIKLALGNIARKGKDVAEVVS
jgi:hypothetical protein